MDETDKKHTVTFPLMSETYFSNPEWTGSYRKHKTKS